MKPRYLLYLFLFNLALLTGGCDWECLFFHRNSKLELVLTKENAYLCFPRWSPDDRIFYLEKIAEPWWGYGTLKVVNLDGTDEREVIDGLWTYFDLSDDGSKIAVTNDTIILLITPEGEVLDTIYHSQPYVECLRFGHEDTFLYYYAWGGGRSQRGFYRLNLYTGEEEFVKPYEEMGFDGFEVVADTIVLMGSYPSLNPTNSQYLITEGGGLYLFSLSTGDTIRLDARPYCNSGIKFPSWDPSGKDVIFSAGEMIGCIDPGCRLINLEIWILRDVLEE